MADMIALVPFATFTLMQSAGGQTNQTIDPWIDSFPRTAKAETVTIWRSSRSGTDPVNPGDMEIIAGLRISERASVAEK